MMEFGVVSTASIIGMVFSLIIAICLPIALIIVAKAKFKSKLSTFFIGAGTFIVSAMILEQIFHLIALSLVGEENITSSIWIYGLYGGLAAAVFEETGRFIAMKFFLKKNLDRKNAFMYGIGHGGIEAMLIVGLTCVSNIASSMAINSGTMENVLSVLDDNTKQQTYEQLSQLWTLPSYQFYMGGIERILAIAAQIVMAFFMYKGVKFAKKQFILLAYLYHFLIDFSTVVLAKYLPISVVEIVIFVYAVLGIWIAYNINRNEGVVSQEA